MTHLTDQQKAARYDRMAEIMATPEFAEAVGVLFEDIEPVEQPEPELNTYQVCMSVMECNTYTVAVTTTSEERALELVNQLGVSSPTIELDEGEDYCYSFESWADGNFKHDFQKRDDGIVTDAHIIK